MAIARRSLLSTFMLRQESGYTVYVEQPLPTGVVASTDKGWALLTSLVSSSALDWEEVPVTDLRIVPRVVMSGTKRLVAMVAGPSHPTTPPLHLVFVTLHSKSAVDRDR